MSNLKIYVATQTKGDLVEATYYTPLTKDDIYGDLLSLDGMVVKGCGGTGGRSKFLYPIFPHAIRTRSGKSGSKIHVRHLAHVSHGDNASVITGGRHVLCMSAGVRGERQSVGWLTTPEVVTCKRCAEVVADLDAKAKVQYEELEEKFIRLLDDMGEANLNQAVYNTLKQWGK